VALVKEKAPNLDFGVAFLPGPSQGDVSSFAGGDVLTIPAPAKHAAKALEFLNWLLTDEPQLESTPRSGNLPSRTDLTKNKYFAADPRLIKTAEALAIAQTPGRSISTTCRTTARALDHDGADGDLRRRHRRGDREGKDADEADPVQRSCSRDDDLAAALGPTDRQRQDGPDRQQVIAGVVDQPLAGQMPRLDVIRVKAGSLVGRKQCPLLPPPEWLPSLAGFWTSCSSPTWAWASPF
jgi:hypothetical protein